VLPSTTVVSTSIPELGTDIPITDFTALHSIRKILKKKEELVPALLAAKTALKSTRGTGSSNGIKKPWKDHIPT
jgi:hypothetical protein